jgi:HEPN domain-containing protein
MERSADWMDQARGDLDHARHDIAAEFYDWACFSAQQSAEKSVKAVLQKRGLEAWGHSVADLLRALASEMGTVSPDILDRAHELDKAYIPTRYPDAHATGSPRRQYTKPEATRLVNHADEILRFCEGLLSSI